MTTRPVQPRLWRGLALAGTAATLAATTAMADQRAIDLAREMGATLWLAEGEAGESGEAGEAGATQPAPAEGGEGGEGGEAGGIASGNETVDFLAGLIQIEGHLTSSFALFDAGDAAEGGEHLGHPGAEVYESIEHELEELGLPQFEELLEELAETAEAGGDAAALHGLHAQILSNTEAAWQTASAAEPADAFAAIRHIVLKAGEEWAEGVVDGAIVELHEYQDAWGFIEAARARATGLAKSEDANVAAAAEATLAALADLAPALPGVLPEGAIGGDASLFAATAARIELAAFKVK